MSISRRNYEDFKKEIQRLSIASDSSFDDLTINELKNLLDSSENLLKEWTYLDSDIEDMFSIIENIEE